MDDQEIVTVRDICKIARSDMPQKLKDKIHDIVCFSMGQVINRKKYKSQLTKSHKKSINQQLIDLIKTSDFREEFVENLTFNLVRRAKYYHYVAIFGQDFDLAVKYSKKTLI